ncbi:MAG: hypothetical protein DCO96_05015 [Fluviicola sp. XM-24bin1]|nr:MAG: hypothetical protein DCO96_05015 [Fluviicola sp. XM-24bin1]
MKAYHYLLSWLLTLVVGMVFNIVLLEGNTEDAFAYTVLAAIFSLPFILLFSGVMWGFLRSKPEKMTVHLITFMLHLLGAVLTFSALMVVFGDLLPDEFETLIAMYFLVDSIFFHLFIYLKHDRTVVIENNILDDQL